jgi:hypothetical protein
VVTGPVLRSGWGPDVIGAIEEFGYRIGKRYSHTEKPTPLLELHLP